MKEADGGVKEYTDEMQRAVETEETGMQKYAHDGQMGQTDRMRATGMYVWTEEIEG